MVRDFALARRRLGQRRGGMHRHDRMVRQPERLEAERLGLARERGRADAVFIDYREDADLHCHAFAIVLSNACRQRPRRTAMRSWRRYAFGFFGSVTSRKARIASTAVGTPLYCERWKIIS